MINYKKHNRCTNCELQFPKSKKNCTECGLKLRTQSRSKKIEREVVRI